MFLRTHKLGGFAAAPLALFILCTPPSVGAQTAAQATSPAAATSQRGTIKTIEGTSITLSTDTGKQIAVTLTPATRLVQVPPGSTDLKASQPIDLSEIAIGDRVLVTARSSDNPDALTASRVIVMKSTDIADRNAARQMDWQRHGSGGVVGSVDGATGTITLTSGVRKVAVTMTTGTVFRRYAGDSVRFEDAQAGTLGQIQVGDQMRVRGTRSEDGTTIQAEEIVSGSFRNLAGTVASIDSVSRTVTLKDLATKKTFVVAITANSDFRKLPPEAAARFAARSRPSQMGSSTPVSGNRPSENGTPRPAARQAASGEGASSPSVPGPPSGSNPATPGNPDRGSPAQIHSGTAPDLAQMFPHLPADSLADLKAGAAVMIVVSMPQAGGSSVTAITMLSGVEPILAASPAGAAPGMALSPWNVGGATPGAGDGGGQ